MRLGQAFIPVILVFLGDQSLRGGEKSLFIDKDLTGWEGLIAEHWSYKDSALVGLAPQGLKFNTFLCSKKKYGEHHGGKKDKNGLEAGGMMKQAPVSLVKKALKEGDFNDYYIKCTGKHVTIKLNGHTTVDDDFLTMESEGIIAWQIHAGPPM